MWSLRLNLTQRGKTYQGRTRVGLTGKTFFQDFLVSGAWPFLVGGVICLVNSDNERDLNLLISWANPSGFVTFQLLRETVGV